MASPPEILAAQAWAGTSKVVMIDRKLALMEGTRDGDEGRTGTRSGDEGRPQHINLTY
jgi:hypothetical protein